MCARQDGVSPSDVVTVEGFNQALVYGFRGDNSGPPSVKEVLSDFAAIRKMFPNATVASSISMRTQFNLEGFRFFRPTLRRSRKRCCL